MSVRGTAAPLTDSVALTFQSLSHFLKYGRKPEHQQEENALHSGVRTHSVINISSFDSFNLPHSADL